MRTTAVRAHLMLLFIMEPVKQVQESFRIPFMHAVLLIHMPEVAPGTPVLESRRQVPAAVYERVPTSTWKLSMCDNLK